jgi:hypothetical protein
MRDKKVLKTSDWFGVDNNRLFVFGEMTFSFSVGVWYCSSSVDLEADRTEAWYQ